MGVTNTKFQLPPSSRTFHTIHDPGWMGGSVKYVFRAHYDSKLKSESVSLTKMIKKYKNYKNHASYYENNETAIVISLISQQCDHLTLEKGTH